MLHIMYLETLPLSGSVKTYLEYVVQQKIQVEETEQIVLNGAQKSQNAYYNTECYGVQCMVQKLNQAQEDEPYALVWPLENHKGPV